MAATDQGEISLSLLYVEDDRRTRIEISEILCRRYPDLHLYIAANGDEGLEKFKQYLPQIVITDINMPILDGMTMTAKIKSIHPTTEIIALTAFSNIEYLLQAIDMGISCYLVKPLDIEKLFAAIDKTLVTIRSESTIVRQYKLIHDLNSELVRKATELELANHELEAFDYTVAHDLRSPLVNISGLSRLLLDHHSANLDEAAKGHLHVINREIMRMNSLIGALFRFSVYSQKNVAKKWTNLSAIANEIRDHLLEQSRGRKVSFRIAEDINAYCDPELIKILLENLLNNAWKYSINADEALIEFDYINRKADLVYFVRDNGIGFDQDGAKKLFLPFQRCENKENIEGFGIGLATVQRIIQRHGGKVWAEGEMEKGATFCFTL
jgi:two-component system, sensor histidine kinase and response regulator